MSLYQFEINIGNEKYPYYLSDNTKLIIENLFSIETDCFVIVYDNSIDKKRIAEIKNRIMEKVYCTEIGVKINEISKNINTLSKIMESIIKKNITRQSCLIAMGGGVLGNIAGLAASLIYRGIRLIHFPTTIIAAADSVLSLKQAINSFYGKNLIGTFYKPEMVLTDHNFFKSLSVRDNRAGQVELIKNILVITPEDISLFLENFNSKSAFSFNEFKLLIDLSIKAKCKVLMNDRFEKHEGLVLEYGHTVGHAIELLSKGRIIHGESIAFGMAVAGEISRELGYIKNEELEYHYNLLDHIDIGKALTPIFVYKPADILKVMEYDNKRGYIRHKNDYIPMVILESLGKCRKTNGRYIVSVEKSLIINGIHKAMNKFRSLNENQCI